MFSLFFQYIFFSKNEINIFIQIKDLKKIFRDFYDFFLGKTYT
jgi:hypothetical protein